MKKRVLSALDEISSEGKKNKLAIEISKENNFDIAQVVERSKVIVKKYCITIKILIYDY